jgi:hypothetical protein
MPLLVSLTSHTRHFILPSIGRKLDGKSGVNPFRGTNSLGQICFRQGPLQQAAAAGHFLVFRVRDVRTFGTRADHKKYSTTIRQVSSSARRKPARRRVHAGLSTVNTVSLRIGCRGDDHHTQRPKNRRGNPVRIAPDAARPGPA